MLVAGSSAAVAQTTWAAGSTIPLNNTFTVTDVLTIEPGVTVRMAGATFFIVGPTGTLIVEGTDDDPVVFTSQSGVWQGIVFEPGSEGEITGAIVEKSVRYGIEIVGASPTIRSSTIRDVGLPTTTSSWDVAGVLVRESAEGQTANPVILESIIENVVGFRGSPGSSGSSGAPGESGANGVLLSPTGENGEDGSVGFIGGTGGMGSTAYGVRITDGARATLGYNTIRNIRGGRGGRGGQGGLGGRGGNGGDGFSGLASGGNGGHGGFGALGGPGGRGGEGGLATAISVESTAEHVYVFQNLVHDIESGPGGDGGQRGNGGPGGSGGDGGDCSAPFCAAGHGGNGGPGGWASSFGGRGGHGGTALFADFLDSGLITLVNNTFAPLRRGVGGPGGAGGTGGVGGVRGIGGAASGSGTNGSNGISAPPGSDSGPGASGEPGDLVGVHARGNQTEIQLRNNILALDGAGTMLISGLEALTSADYNLFSGFSTLTVGSTVLGANNVEGSPQFVDPGLGDFRLGGASNIGMDAGSNAAVPPDVFDFDDDGDTVEPVPFDLAGNARITDNDLDGVATVEIGALEGGDDVQVIRYRSAATEWLNVTQSEARAFDEFFGDPFDVGGCLLPGDSDQAVIPLDGGTLTVSSFRGATPICSVIDASSAFAVSDAVVDNSMGDGMLVLEFDPPVTGFYTYLGSLALGQTVTMTLYRADSAALDVLDTITSTPSANAVLAAGIGFRSLTPVSRIEVTTTEAGVTLLGAFAGLLASEPSLGSVEIVGYPGPSGFVVEFDFACEFVAPPPCAPDINGDGEINFTDLNSVLSAFGESGQDLPADVNDDGVVNFTDLNVVLTAFGTECPS
jgi:hypothetical protein